MGNEERTSRVMDLDGIRQREDRGWTARLLARLGDPHIDEEERKDIAGALTTIADPRCEQPLQALLVDTASPALIREAAGWILRELDWLDRETYRAQFDHGDELLRRHAVLCMGPQDADIVESIARDPSHPLHLSAIETMMFGFEHPRFQPLKIQALSHPEPAVRRAAADTLLWDEPAAAEEPLLRAAFDEATEVAGAAIATLAYYPTTRCLRALAELRGRGGEIGEAAAASIEDIRWKLRLDLQYPKRGGAHLRAWLQPVWEILGYQEAELQPETGSLATSPSPIGKPVASADLIALLDDPDGAWADKKELLRRMDAAAADRAALTPVFLGHADPAVREAGARFLAAWNDHESLLRLAEDRGFGVRKAAVYELGRTTRDERVARFARQHLDAPGVGSTHAWETLETYVAHAGREEAVALCSRMLREDPRESTRIAAVHALIKARARDELLGLLDLLREPPAVTWAIHTGVLEACEKLSLPPGDLTWLKTIDHADVQHAIAPFWGEQG